MIRSVVVSALVLLLTSHLAYSRSIGTGYDRQNSASDGSSRSFMEWPLSASTETCEPPYGFLPCSSNAWGLLFLIVVYEILLSYSGQFVATGSNLFFQIIGPGLVGGSVFQMLGTIPHLVMVLVPALTSTTAQAQERATSGIGMVLGAVAMNLTLVWGLIVVFGSYDQSENAAAIVCQVPGSSVVTDVETSWTARLVLVACVPLLILELQNLFTSSSVKRVIILIALIITVLLLFGYILYQSFQPWIQNRCFEYMIDKYAKDKILNLISTNGRPDTLKMQMLFNKIDKDNNTSVTAREIRVLVLGVNIEDDDTSANLDLETITSYFDTSGDGGINQDEFVRGMTKLASNLLDQTPIEITNGGSNNSKITSQDQQPLLASNTSTSTSRTATNSWSIYVRATFFVIVGTFFPSAVAQPLVKSIIEFSTVANLSSFWVSYVVLPLALSYGIILRSISSAAQKTQKSNSLTLSSLYGGVFMNNIMGMMPFLAPVYFRNLSSSDALPEILLVLLICLVMGTFTSFKTTFPRWTGYVAILLYPISLTAVYFLT